MDGILKGLREWMESLMTSRMDGILKDFEDGWNLRRLLWVQLYDVRF